MAKIIGLPKLSPTMEEGTLVAWTKKEGDAVEIDDLLAEVETDKATMEFRSFDRGVLLKILVPEGETLAPDVPVAIIGKEGEDISELLAQVSASEPASEPAPEPAPASESAPAPEPAPSPTTNGGRILSSPLVRKLAREQGIDLGTVRGSGPKGRIIKRDLENVQPSRPIAGATSAAGVRQPPIVEKASSMRRTIARRLTESKQNVPHYYLTIDVDATPIWNARKKMNAALEKQGDKVSLNDILIKACAVALVRVPAVNSSWIDGEIHRHQVVDISVAVAIEDGLVTPVIRDAEKKGVLAINQEVKELAERAKNKRLKPEEMTGGTFSISNLGMYGITEFSAVINPPEGAILAVGTVRSEPVVQGDSVVPGRRMQVTLSCDHRVIDGAVGAQFMAELRALLEAPLNMLL